MAHTDFSLFETMLMVEDSIFLFRLHLMRLYRSAKKLGFACKHIESLLNNLPNTPHTPQSRCYKSFCDTISQNHAREKLHTLQLALHFLESLNYNQAKNHIMGFQTSAKCSDEYPYLWDSTALLHTLLHEANHCNPLPQGAFLCRLTLQKNGTLFFMFHPLQKVTNNAIFLATQSHTHSPHKTTQRAHFAQATDSIAKNECFDYIYMDGNGMLLEGSRSNIVLAMRGVYYTPKADNILEGTLRNVLIEYGICKEKILYKEDLYKADSLYCINSVRGIVPVALAVNAPL